MEKKYILSMDGGGVRTLASITFLKRLEIALKTRIADKFDYFIGTSAGAVSCLALAVNAAKIIDLEDIWAPRNINRTMSNSSWESKFGLLQGRPKYDNVGKLFVLKKYFGKSIMMDAKKPVAVTSYDIEKRKPVLIRSYSEADSKIKIIDAANATSAAPIYFPTAKVEDRYLIDGAIVANNPVLHGYAEAIKLFPNTELKVLSVGTGLSKRPLKGEASQNWGVVGWMMHDLFGLMVESSLDHELAGDLIGENYLRVNSPLGTVNRRLDDKREANIKKIVEMGESWWEEFGSNALKLLTS